MQRNSFQGRVVSRQMVLADPARLRCSDRTYWGCAEEVGGVARVGRECELDDPGRMYWNVVYNSTIFFDSNCYGARSLFTESFPLFPKHKPSVIVHSVLAKGYIE